ncbi:MAG: histidine--tRNA ligase [Cyclobacteriaceae bacterium]|nr:histidine--tRNA ligase [Cyclobacteriaceae bacterium]
MENLTTLTGKYGEEGDQLLFKILNSGDFSKKIKSKVILRDKLVEFLFGFYKGPFEKLTFEKRDEIRFEQELKDYLEKFIRENPDAEIFNLLEVVRSNKQLIFDSLIETNATLKIYPTKTGYLSITQLSSKLVSNLTDNDIYNNASDISEKGLRYDLTVPFARYVVMNRHEITFPFKRYQIQPVWRADRPQKGRYREFYQCDADVVGTDSLICEAEIILMIKEVFRVLGISDYTIKVNHRGILGGLADFLNAKGKESDLFTAIDKLDKVGKDKVREELTVKGFSEDSISTLFDIIDPNRDPNKKEQDLNLIMATSERGLKGSEDIYTLLSLLKDFGSNEDHVYLDFALARGLSYYTGCIFEVKINNVSIGSVSGGGRYDNLTGVFGMPGVSGVGFSFGVDRLYDAMEELKLFPQEAQISSKVMIAHFDAESKRYGLGILQALRNKGIAAEIYQDSVKIQKQLEYANKKLIPFTIILGSEEMKSGLLAFKNMKTGEQQKITLDKIIALFKTNNE